MHHPLGWSSSLGSHSGHWLSLLLQARLLQGQGYHLGVTGRLCNASLPKTIPIRIYWKGSTVSWFVNRFTFQCDSTIVIASKFQPSQVCAKMTQGRVAHSAFRSLPEDLFDVRGCDTWNIILQIIIPMLDSCVYAKAIAA